MQLPLSKITKVSLKRNFYLFDSVCKFFCKQVVARLRMVAKHYGKNYSLHDLRQLTNTTRAGSSLLGISEAAEKIGFRTIGVKVSYDKLKHDAPALHCHEMLVCFFRLSNSSGWGIKNTKAL